MSQRPNPQFFAELNRRINAGENLARQNHFADARAQFSSALDFAAESGVTVPISLILDTWANLFWCAIGLDDFNLAAAYVRAADAFLMEFDENQRAGRYKQGNPTNDSYTLVHKLIPPTLHFAVPENFNVANDLKRLNSQRPYLDPRLESLEHVMGLLYGFAGFYCGASNVSGKNFNWYVKKDRLTLFTKEGHHAQFDAGILVLSDQPPQVEIHVALQEAGCHVSLVKEFPIPEIPNRVAMRTLREQTITQHRLALWAFLNSWVKEGVIVPSGDRFKLGIE